MFQKNFALDTPVKQAEFAVREDHTLAVKLQLGCGSRTLAFHDFIRKPGQRFYLFNSKTEISGSGDTVTVRAATTETEVTLSVYENEYDLPQSIEDFDVCDGFVLLGMESANGIRKLRCRIAPEGVGILNWRNTQ